MTIQPSLFIPHGGGPCFFMPDPRGTWTKMGDYLRALPATLPEPPRPAKRSTMMTVPSWFSGVV